LRFIEEDFYYIKKMNRLYISAANFKRLKSLHVILIELIDIID